MSHYEILEVSPNASPEVIKAAYRSLMQRYHPDRNPGDVVSAERASLVVQAYAVLSDSSNRAAYDIKLNQQLTAHLTSNPNKHRVTATQPARAAKDNQSYWLVWLLSAVIILSGGVFLSLSKKQLSPESELKELRLSIQEKQLAPEQLQTQIKRVDEILRTHPEILKKEARAQAKALLARTVPMLITNLTVSLRTTDAASSSVHILSIPMLDAIVGTFDPEKVMRNLVSNQVLINQKLVERLADTKYEELIKIDSEHYLKEIILDSIGETIGANRRENYPSTGIESPARYGVIEVSLPQSFSVY
jgi:curved DNA-binding protein CbpA